MPDETTEELLLGLRDDLRGIARGLQVTIADLEHAEQLLQVEFNAGGISGLRAEAIASIRRARLRLAAALA